MPTKKNGRPPKHGVNLQRKPVYLLPSQIEWLRSAFPSMSEGVRMCIETHREQNVKDENS